MKYWKCSHNCWVKWSTLEVALINSSLAVDIKCGAKKLEPTIPPFNSRLTGLVMMASISGILERMQGYPETSQFLGYSSNIMVLRKCPKQRPRFCKDHCMEIKEQVLLVALAREIKFEKLGINCWIMLPICWCSNHRSN